MNQNLIDDIDNLNKPMKQITKEQNETVKQLHDLEQYGHRENLKIDGVPFSKQENTHLSCTKSG